MQGKGTGRAAADKNILHRRRVCAAEGNKAKKTDEKNECGGNAHKLSLHSDWSAGRGKSFIKKETGTGSAGSLCRVVYEPGPT